jgi:hypothetical protein
MEETRHTKIHPGNASPEGLHVEWRSTRPRFGQGGFEYDLFGEYEEYENNSKAIELMRCK